MHSKDSSLGWYMAAVKGLGNHYVVNTSMSGF